MDVWDAILSDRPYREAYSREDAVKHIKQQSGKHFDPAVVKAFLSLLEEDSLLENQKSQETANNPDQ